MRWAVVRSDFSWRMTGLVGSRAPGARERLVCEEERVGVVVSLRLGSWVWEGLVEGAPRGRLSWSAWTLDSRKEVREARRV